MVRVRSTVAEFGLDLERTRALGQTVGLVPTMGALHAGHRSLIERAAADCDTVAVTIFVNPLQFGDPDDMDRYPRTLEADLGTCERAGATVVLAPSVREMYPDGPTALRSAVTVSGLTDRWEGASRPGHFDGVTTVVAKLFALAGRCRAYFGEKDFQQLAVVRRMAADLSFPVEVVGCPTVREPDGLALSSRNVRLSAADRSAAPVLARALERGDRALAAGERSPAAVAAVMAGVVASQPRAALDYAAVVDPDDLAEPDALEPGHAYRLIIAAVLGVVRLIDNAPAFAASTRAAPPATLPAAGAPAPDALSRAS